MDDESQQQQQQQQMQQLQQQQQQHGHHLLQTGSPYMFKPIQEKPDESSPGCVAVDAPPSGGFSGGGIVGTGAAPEQRLSVGSRMRFNSGGQPLTSPTSLSVSVSRPTPKSHAWRTSCEHGAAAWSSQGSRHSSRPGSSASSRPPSQPGRADLYSRDVEGSS